MKAVGNKLLIGGGMAVVLVCCAPSGIEMIGDAMVDAGHMLMDAGQSLADGSLPDASAQSCASSCSNSGALRVVTADTDPAQRARGTVTTGVALINPTYPDRLAGATFELARGPLVVDHVGHTKSSPDFAGVQITYYVSNTGSCLIDQFEVLPVSVGGHREMNQLAFGGTGYVVATDRVPVGNLFLAADERLCAFGYAGPFAAIFGGEGPRDPPTTFGIAFSWTGYRPYL